LVDVGTHSRQEALRGLFSIASILSSFNPAKGRSKSVAANMDDPPISPADDPGPETPQREPWEHPTEDEWDADRKNEEMERDNPC